MKTINDDQTARFVNASKGKKLCLTALIAFSEGRVQKKHFTTGSEFLSKERHSNYLKQNCSRHLLSQYYKTTLPGVTVEGKAAV